MYLQIMTRDLLLYHMQQICLIDKFIDSAIVSLQHEQVFSHFWGRPGAGAPTGNLRKLNLDDTLFAKKQNMHVSDILIGPESVLYVGICRHVFLTLFLLFKLICLDENISLFEKGLCLFLSCNFGCFFFFSSFFSTVYQLHVQYNPVYSKSFEILKCGYK